ncbi:unnamed protein product [Owenia fusiformis]|uniref:Lipocalin/cytosolic fatty-acid binding domain-containing protein n=1 Tax=Owenia fusiformis TaxID=6347 RepID=A0A8S4P5B7_OWEFU|nr:unnamed protein product [Owenia fusiformis]
MMHKMMGMALLVVLPTFCLGFLADDIFDQAPKTVDKVDIEKYLGRWYQAYSNKNMEARFLKDAFCVHADYTLVNATTITVRNSNRRRSPTGPLGQIEGFGYKSESEGKLWIKLNNGRLNPSPFWILKLGPVINGQYQYAVSSDPLRFALFVLTRNPSEFYEKYNDEVLEFLKEQAFTNEGNKPQKSYQGDDCLYVEPQL